jgi:hypothetical protein
MNRFRLLPRPTWWGTRTARLSGLAAIGLASFVVSSVPALPAQAATQTAPIKISSSTSTGWVPVVNTDYTYPAGQFCTDEIDVHVILSKQYMDTITFANGTTLTLVKGPYVLRFTNVTTGQTVVRNVSGSTATIVYPSKLGTETGTGNNVWGFGPQSQINTREPGLVFTSGPVAINFNLNLNPPQATSFSLQGTQVNGCTLLGAS